MDNHNNSDGEDEVPVVNEERFTLSKAMMNAKQVNSLRNDLKNFKGVLGEMQIYIKDHEIKMRSLVKVEELKITSEMFSN